MKCIEFPHLGWFRKVEILQFSRLHKIVAVDSFLVLILTYFIFSGAALCIKLNLVTTTKWTRFRKESFSSTFSFYTGCPSDKTVGSAIWACHEIHFFSHICYGVHLYFVKVYLPHQEQFINILWTVIRGKWKKLIGIFWRHSMIFVSGPAQYFLWLDIFMSP